MSGAKVVDGATIQLPEEATLDPDGAGADLFSKNTSTATDLEAIHLAHGAGPSEEVFTTTTPLNDGIQLAYGGPGLLELEQEKELFELKAEELVEVLPTLEANLMQYAFTAEQVRAVTLETLRRLDSNQLKALVISHLKPFSERADFDDDIRPLLHDANRSIQDKNRAIASEDPGALGLEERGYSFFDGLTAQVLGNLSKDGQVGLLNGMNSDTLAAFVRNKGELSAEIAADALPKLDRNVLRAVAPYLEAEQLGSLPRKSFGRLLPALSPEQIAGIDSVRFDKLGLGVVKALLTRGDIEGKLTKGQLQAMSAVVFKKGNAALIARYAELDAVAPDMPPSEPVQPETGMRSAVEVSESDQVYHRYSRGSLPQLFQVVRDRVGYVSSFSSSRDVRMPNGETVTVNAHYLPRPVTLGMTQFGQKWERYQHAVAVVGKVLAAELSPEQQKNPPRIDQLPEDIQKFLKPWIKEINKLDPTIQAAFGGDLSDGGDRRTIGGIPVVISPREPFGEKAQDATIYSLGASLRFVHSSEKEKFKAAVKKTAK